MEHDSEPEAYCVHVWIRAIHPMLWLNVSKSGVSATVGRPVAMLYVSSKGHPETVGLAGLRVELSHKKTTFP